MLFSFSFSPLLVSFTRGDRDLSVLLLFSFFFFGTRVLATKCDVF